MQDLMAHPFLTTDDPKVTGAMKLTILDQEDFHKDVLRCTEIQNPSVKQTFTPKMATEVQPNWVELTTQDQIQTQVLKNHL